MFRCQRCGRAVGPRVSAMRLVTESRKVTHPFRPRSKKVWQSKNGKWKKDWEPDYGGVGLQVAAEALVCPECARAAPQG